MKRRIKNSMDSEEDAAGADDSRSRSIKDRSDNGIQVSYF